MERTTPLTPPCSQPSICTPAPSVAGHQRPDLIASHPLNNKKSGPDSVKSEKNRLHSRGIWAKIASRRIIRAGREVREHPTPLCRRKRLPHSKITCATLIIPIIPLFYKGNLHGLVCCLGLCRELHTCTALLFAPQPTHGGRECPAPTGRSAGEHWHTNLYK